MSCEDISFSMTSDIPVLYIPVQVCNKRRGEHNMGGQQCCYKCT